MNAVPGATAWPETIDIAGTRLVIRPIDPSDIERERAFVLGLSDASSYSRFMMPVHELSPAWLKRFTEIDGRRTMALVATALTADSDRFVGVARYFGDADCVRCEFAVTVSDDWQHRGLGRLLMQKLIAHARSVGFRLMFGFVLRVNVAMLTLAHRLGFVVEPEPGEPTDPMVERVALRLGKH